VTAYSLTSRNFTHRFGNHRVRLGVDRALARFSKDGFQYLDFDQLDGFIRESMQPLKAAQKETGR